MELFETENIYSPDNEIVLNNSETETIVSLIDSNVLAGGGEEISTPAETLPDAIPIENENPETVHTTPNSSQEEQQEIATNNLTIQSPAESSNSEIEQNLNDIYLLLSERLPERSIESESESETERQIEYVSETEVTLYDVRESINSLALLESEQNERLQSIESSVSVFGSNYVVYSDFLLSGLMAFWGSFIIYLFFRKIG